MKLRFSKKENLILGIVALLVVALIVLAQFFYLSPLKTDLKKQQSSLDIAQKKLEAISQQKTQDSQQTVEDTKELQKKLPVKPLQEQLILDLEKAENVSDSEIKTMSFSKDADVSSGTNQTVIQNTAQQQSSTTTTSQPATSSQSTANQDTANQQSSGTVVPEGMKKITANLTVESPTYEDFEKFIDALESLNRIIVVESISYTGGQEITSLSQQNQPLAYSLTFSAFYMPGLNDLQAQLPKIDAPAPAGKENPLSQFPDVTH
ncbi:hypothetical protein [Neobacillus sp. LXY-1]